MATFFATFIALCHLRDFPWLTASFQVLAPTTPRKLFVREAGIWRGLRHRNVLQLFGASSAVEGGMWFLVSTVSISERSVKPNKS